MGAMLTPLHPATGGHELPTCDAQLSCVDDCQRHVLHMNEPKPPKASSHEQVSPVQPLRPAKHDWQASDFPVSRARHVLWQDVSVAAVLKQGLPLGGAQTRRHRVSGVSGGVSSLDEHAAAMVATNVAETNQRSFGRTLISLNGYHSFHPLKDYEAWPPRPERDGRGGSAQVSCR